MSAQGQTSLEPYGVGGGQNYWLFAALVELVSIPLGWLAVCGRRSLVRRMRAGLNLRNFILKHSHRLRDNLFRIGRRYESKVLQFKGRIAEDASLALSVKAA